MSGRLLAFVLLLVVTSAAVGAGAAFLLRQADDAAQSESQVFVAATTSPSERSEETPGVQESSPAEDEFEQAGSQIDSVSGIENRQSQSTPQDVPEPPRAQATEQQQPNVVEGQAGEDEQPARDEHSAIETPEQAQVEPLPVVSITPDLLTQGEALSLTVESEAASAVIATIAARSWELAEVEAGVWWMIIAIPRDAPTGSSEIAVDMYGEGGVWLRSFTAPVVVLANAAPFEEVTLGGTGTPADPAEVQRDHDVRFVDHVSVNGPARWQGPWILPVQGEVTGVFGAKRSYDGVPSDSWHHGHDIGADHGDPIVAPAAGTVVWTGELVIHGIGVIIDHGAGVYSGYWHMSLIAVREGMEVAPGDWLGNIGTTGLSTGPHLHWEVIIQGIDVDPIQWLGEQQPPLPPVAPEPEQTTDTLN